MIDFHIYTSLQQTIQSSDTINSKQLISGIQLLPPHLEIIYSLIVHHFIITHKNSQRAIEILNKHLDSKRSKKFIYNGERLVGGKGFIFDLDKLPSDLLDIIYTYILTITTH